VDRALKLCFDADGTVLDVSRRHHRVYAQTIRLLGGKPLTKREYWQLRRRDIEWQQILVESGLKPELLSAFLQRFIERIESPDMLATDRLVVDGEASLRTLSDEHCLYLVSLRRSQPDLMDELDRLRVGKYFDRVAVGHGEAAPYRNKVDLIARIPDFDGIVIGDTEADILAAKELNLMSVAVLSGIRGIEYLRTLKPDFIVGGIRDVPRLIEGPGGSQLR
jgi:phosphoglycolate phosphatase-like HAD superfamily hydrolase